jgi:hypothetical protein
MDSNSKYEYFDFDKIMEEINPLVKSFGGVEGNDRPISDLFQIGWSRRQ